METATPFDILPAIDLLDGRVVRLVQGDFARETVYGDDPVVVARAFAGAGGRWLHVVDLDGARAGEPMNRLAVEALMRAVGDGLRVEIAGGLRTEASVATVLGLGAARAVVGTAALQDPAFAGRLVAGHGASRIAVAIDVRDGSAVGHGWVAGAAGVDAAETIARLADVGVTTFEVTAIDRDGLLGGPDLGLYERLVALHRGQIIASGGIASVPDLLALRERGCSGAIVGRALLDGSMALELALSVV
jgi:phosphoribosylformimino-5-aminoimidazole carboxamide ribotide isomerase